MFFGLFLVMIVFWVSIVIFFVSENIICMLCLIIIFVML